MKSIESEVMKQIRAVLKSSFRIEIESVYKKSSIACHYVNLIKESPISYQHQANYGSNRPISCYLCNKHFLNHTPGEHMAIDKRWLATKYWCCINKLYVHDFVLYRTLTNQINPISLFVKNEIPLKKKKKQTFIGFISFVSFQSTKINNKKWKSDFCKLRHFGDFPLSQVLFTSEFNSFSTGNPNPCHFAKYSKKFTEHFIATPPLTQSIGRDNGWE